MEKKNISGQAAVNGISMYYEIHGSGAMPLVLLHGGGSTIETSFGELLPLLSAHRKVIAIELQAHGRTSDREAPETFTQDADDVAALLTYLNIARVNILGFSNGGTTTLQMAIRYPQLVNKMVIVSGAYQRDGFMDGFFDGFANATLANMPAALQAAFLKVTPDENKLQNMFDKDVARMVNFTDIPDADIGAIKTPALIMSAHRDVVTVEHNLKMAQLIPGAQLVILPGLHGQFIGEMGMAVPGSTLPGVTATLVTEFLKD